MFFYLQHLGYASSLFFHKSSIICIFDRRNKAAVTMAAPMTRAGKPEPPAVARRVGRPLSIRKLDILYLAFFVIHVPVMLCKLAHFVRGAGCESCLLVSSDLAVGLVDWLSNRPRAFSARRRSTAPFVHAPVLLRRPVRRPVLHGPAGLVYGVHGTRGPVPPPDQRLDDLRHSQRWVTAITLSNYRLASPPSDVLSKLLQITPSSP